MPEFDSGIFLLFRKLVRSDFDYRGAKTRQVLKTCLVLVQLRNGVNYYATVASLVDFL